MTHRVLFYVQHLLGVGHVKRASVIARAMADAGLDVSVVLGGREVPGIAFDGCARIPLPPVHAADETIRTLVDDTGAPMDDALRELRTARLVQALRTVSPHALLVEQFPFGRRAFRFELLPLLAAARAQARRPAILCSVRDVLVERTKPSRNEEMVRWASTLFDGVLVHGDPAVIRLDDTFPAAATIADKLVYTGYVVEQPAHLPDRETGRGEVVVSVGGGAVGAALLEAAVAARPLTCLADRPWRLITGANLPADVYDRLAWQAPAGVIVDRWRTDMPVLLRNCLLSISQAGYNTVMDVLAAGPRAIVVPFAAEGQTEQTVRARMLAKRAGLGMVDGGGVTPDVLARAVDVAVTGDPVRPDLDLDGAERSARLVAAFCRGEDAGKA